MQDMQRDALVQRLQKVPSNPQSVSCDSVLQYAAMFVSAGEAGDAKKVQTSVAAARKVFRIFRVSLRMSGCMNPPLTP